MLQPIRAQDGSAKVELSSQSKVQLAVGSICLAAYAAPIAHNKGVQRYDYHEMLLRKKQDFRN